MSAGAQETLTATTAPPISPARSVLGRYNERSRLGSSVRHDVGIQPRTRYRFSQRLADRDAIECAIPESEPDRSVRSLLASVCLDTGRSTMSETPEPLPFTEVACGRRYIGPR
jgi:hypothetical protein